MKKAIFKSFIWVMDAMVDGMCPYVEKTIEDRKPILGMAATVLTRGAPATVFS